MEAKTFDFKRLKIRVELQPRLFSDLEFEDGELLVEKEWASVYLNEIKRFYPKDRIISIVLEN
jgi:hypothetical protein